MTSPLEGALARTIGSAFSNVFYAASVTVMVPGDGPVYDPGDPTPVDHDCKGMIDEYSAFERQNSRIEVGDRKVLILATSLDIVPAIDMTVTIRGKAYRIVNVMTDPAQAVYELQCRT